MSSIRHVAPCGKRRGFALPLVIVMALVLGGIFFALDRIVSGYRSRATRFRDGEVAFYAAHGALRLGERALEDLAASPPRSAGWQRDLYELLVQSAADDVGNVEDDLPVPFLDRLLPAGIDAELTLVVRTYRTRPFLSSMPPGFQADPSEKRGILELEARARVRGATRRFLLRRNFATLNLLPPVMGRFGLFFGALEGTPEDANILTYSPRLGLFQRSVSRSLGWPLQLYPLPSNPEEEGMTPAERFRDDPLRPVRDGGWVGLFGENPWVLNTTFGPGDKSPLEEGGLLRNFTVVEPSDRISGMFEQTRRLGFARDILELPMFSGVELGNIPDASSLLQLSGDARAPTPPVVLGRVYRRFLTFTKLGATESGPFTSLQGLSEDDFAAVQARYQVLTNQSDYASYRAMMARSVIEPYNRTYDFIVTDDEVRDDLGRVLPRTTPFTPGQHLGAAAVAPYVAAEAGSVERFLYPDPGRQSEARASGNLEIRDDAEVALYRGSPEDLLPGLVTLLPARALRTYEAGRGAGAVEAFRAAHIQGDDLRLGTTAHIVGEGLDLGPVHVRAGGTLVVEGNVRLSGPLTVARGEVFSVVSLTGNIEILNEHPIAASLIAAQGEVRPAPRGLDVRGQIAAARFAPVHWAGAKGAQRVVYDPRLNPGSSSRRAAHRRLVLGEDRKVLVRRK